MDLGWTGTPGASLVRSGHSLGACFCTRGLSGCLGFASSLLPWFLSCPFHHLTLVNTRHCWHERHVWRMRKATGKKLRREGSRLCCDMSLPVMRGPGIPWRFVNLFSHMKWSKGDQQVSIYLSVNIFTSLHSFQKILGKQTKRVLLTTSDLSIYLPWYTDSIALTF